MTSPLRVGGAPIAVEGIVEFLWGILDIYYNDPTIFLSVLLIYSVLTAIILPIPVEIALIPLLNQIAFLGVAALALGIGKAVGAGAVFLLGLRVEGPIRYWCARHPIAGRFVGYVTRFVRTTKWAGLLVLMSVPFFPDTLPIYLYSLFNKQGQLIGGKVFLLVNLLAGVLRALLFVLLWTLGFRVVVG